MLPKYYVIQRDTNNPLWWEYIKWINIKIGEDLTWDLYMYYWYDWTHLSNWFNCSNYLDVFENNPKLITLEEWNYYINNKPMENKWYMCIVDLWKAPTLIHKTIEEASIEAMRLCSKENRKVSIATIVKVYKPKIIAEEQI